MRDVEAFVYDNNGITFTGEREVNIYVRERGYGPEGRVYYSFKDGQLWINRVKEGEQTPAFMTIPVDILEAIILTRSTEAAKAEGALGESRRTQDRLMTIIEKLVGKQ